MIEGQIEKMQMFVGNATASGTFPCFATTNQAFDSLYAVAVDLSQLFVPQKFIDVRFEFFESLSANRELTTKVFDELRKAESIFVEDGDVTGRLVGDVDFMSLIDQANQSSSHRNYVVVGMG